MTIKEIEDYIENKFDIKFSNIIKPPVASIPPYNDVWDKIAEPRLLGIFLSEEFIEKYIKLLPMNTIVMTQKLSINFIYKHSNIISPFHLIENLFLSKSFKFPYCTKKIYTLEFGGRNSFIGFYRPIENLNKYELPSKILPRTIPRKRDVIKLILGDII